MTASLLERAFRLAGPALMAGWLHVVDFPALRAVRLETAHRDGSLRPCMCIGRVLGGSVDRATNPNPGVPLRHASSLLLVGRP